MVINTHEQKDPNAYKNYIKEAIEKKNNVRNSLVTKSIINAITICALVGTIIALVFAIKPLTIILAVVLNGLSLVAVSWTTQDLIKTIESYKKIDADIKEKETSLNDILEK